MKQPMFEMGELVTTSKRTVDTSKDTVVGFITGIKLDKRYNNETKIKDEVWTYQLSGHDNGLYYEEALYYIEGSR